MYYIGAWCPLRPDEGIGSPGTRVTDSCELPHGCWKSNMGSLKEQPVLALNAEPPLQPLIPALDIGSDLVLPSFMSTWHKLESSERRGPRLRNCLHKIQL